MNQEWSDTESSNDENELTQPDRDFPISDNEDDEDDEYDMYDIMQKTLKNTDLDNLLTKKETPSVKNIQTKKIINNNILVNEQITKTYTKRKFNPRLPPPNKYNKTNQNKFNLNLNDFPTL